MTNFDFCLILYNATEIYFIDCYTQFYSTLFICRNILKVPCYCSIAFVIDAGVIAFTCRYKIQTFFKSIFNYYVSLLIFVIVIADLICDFIARLNRSEILYLNISLTCIRFSLYFARVRYRICHFVGFILFIVINFDLCSVGDLSFCLCFVRHHYFKFNSPLFSCRNIFKRPCDRSRICVIRARNLALTGRNKVNAIVQLVGYGYRSRIVFIVLVTDLISDFRAYVNNAEPACSCIRTYFCLNDIRNRILYSIGFYFVIVSYFDSACVFYLAFKLS